MARVLITGAAGIIGGYLRRGLPALGWQLRLLDLRGLPDDVAGVPDDEDVVLADIRDADALDAAMKNVTAVVHLAGLSGEAPFDEILPANIEGTYQVFEAVRRAGVTRMVYASSNHVVGLAPRSEPVTAATRIRPDTYYGVSKAFGEALASLYADRYGVRTACIRIGSCFDRPSTRRELSTWLSPADCVRLVDACLTSPDLTFTIAYGASANTRALFDLRQALDLGYRPQDDAEEYADDVLSTTPDEDPDSPNARYVGGGHML
jgi:uronate dehydrogenase